MDWGSLAGILLAFAGIAIGQLLEGGHLSSLVQPAAFVLVFVGTAGAVLLQSGLPTFVNGVSRLRAVFVEPPPGAGADLLRNISLWSMTARREGLLSLERFLDRSGDLFIEKGLRLLVDGADAAKLREILEIEIGTFEAAEKRAIKVWEAAGGYSPTIGILGAVLGLIHVMENLSDPSRLGSGIAVAFVATIYGVGLANLLFLPVANKLKARLAQRVNALDRLTDALCAIASGDNPRMIEERLAAYAR
ncbi:MAG: flagellar motor protein [Burkholderiaceae bacterium]